LRRLSLRKCPTGIGGLDEITEGGLPRGRTSLVCGGPGCGKTMLAVRFIVQGILNYGEPGVFMSFEETSEQLAQNVRSLGFDLKDLISRQKLAVDYVRIERSEIEETGEYDLEGLFVRLGSLIDEVGAKGVALDTLEALFSELPNEGILGGGAAAPLPLAEAQGSISSRFHNASRDKHITPCRPLIL
jgi:circadian clock protein KaiC